MIHPRCLRSKPARADLFLATGGKCAICGEDLNERWHADHIIPWDQAGATVPSNLQPTCPSCNRKKGNNMTGPKNYEILRHFTEDFPDSNGMRLCQIGAYNCAIEKLIVEGKLSFSAFLPTGTGKSDLIRALAIGLTNRRYCSGVWAYCPNLSLRHQLKEDGRDETLTRLGVSYSGSYPFSEEDSLDKQRFRNNAVLESWTTQFLITNGNVKRFIAAAQELKRRTGLMPLAIFDESHLFSTDNEWGSAAIKMQEAGIPIGLVTGSPYRSDNIKIPGFTTELIGVSQRKYIKTRKDSDDPLVLHVRKGTLEATKYALKADYEYTFARAWADGIILKPQPAFVDATDVLYDRILSEMSRSQSERLLRSFLMDEKTISASVTFCVKSLRKRKAADPSCAAIVATLSDEVAIADGKDEIADLHARKIEREFARQAPHLRVLIVTNNNNKEDGLKKFKTQYDVLIVKAMGTIGYNCPRIKTVLNLSNIRTLTALIQLINRGCRRFGDNANFDYIMPKDKGMVELWQSFEDETGLEIETTKILEEEEEKITINPEKKAPDSIPQFDNHNVSFDPVKPRNRSDEVIELFDRKLPGYASGTKDRQPLLTLFTTIARTHGDDWLNKLPDFNDQPITTPTLVDPNEEERRLRNQAVDKVKEITAELISITGEPTRYSEYIREVWTCAKRCCGFRPNQSIENLSGIDNFKKLIQAGIDLQNSLQRIPDDGEFDFIRYLQNYGR